MNVICAPSGIIDIDRPRQGAADMAKAGFESMLLDLAMYCSPMDLEMSGKNFVKKGYQTEEGAQIWKELHAGAGKQANAELQKGTKQLLQSAREAHLTIPIATAPYLKRDTKWADGKVLKELLLELTRESIRLCAQAGCRYLIVRPLTTGITADEAWKENRDFYLELAKSFHEPAEAMPEPEKPHPRDITILLENQCRDLNGHLIRGICADPAEAASWVDSLNEAAGEARFGFCMDAGAYNLCGQSMGEIARQLGSRVKAVRLRDCNGQQESSLLPFTAVQGRQPQTDWLSLIRGLREAGFDGELILDMADTAAVFSPLLRPQLLTLAKAVAEYFKWQIGIENTLKKYSSIVLFGAGNMCRNYMKCYGGKYPPLFTCDNNSALWGTTFCGLEVKPPESLAALPKDCAIFICNIYYREIERQLREMDIRNPIEFFNDEYMPSFYFDRLQRK